MDNNKIDCSCASCQKACQYKPGRFKPGEAENAAALLGVSLEKLFQTKLGVDWYEGESPTFAIAPATTTMTPGEEYPANPKGTCVFFVDGKCGIHAAKPFECRELMHTDSRDDIENRTRALFESCEGNQEQIESLLGRKPTAAEYSWLDVLSWS